MFNSHNDSRLAEKELFIAYYPLLVTVSGTVLNVSTFSILCRPVFRDTQKRPTIHYMRVMVVFDTLMLYGCNLDHYLSYAHGFTLQTYSVPLCKISTFLNYFIAQVSAWLCVFSCVDRYLSLSRLYKTWFFRSKNVLIIIGCIVVLSIIINFHLLLFACFYNSDGTVNDHVRLYSLYSMWDLVNLGLYNGAPFVLMVFLNSGVIYYLFRLRRTSQIFQSWLRHHTISIPLFVTIFLFSTNDNANFNRLRFLREHCKKTLLCFY